jgi:regulation of enolase protein 1 (concanavalin A-like superfamily)
MRTFLVLSFLSLFFASQGMADVIVDNFDVTHDFLVSGTAGTIWDGFIGKGTYETVDKLSSNIDAAGQLYVKSTNGRWQDPFPPTNKLGPLLYKNVAGNFTAIVKVTGYQSGVNYNAGGLMARVAAAADAGAGEDWVSTTYFPMFSVNNKMDSTDNGARTEISPWTASVHPYLMLERIGDNFYGRVSDDGISWTISLNSGSPVSRTDMTGLPVQVGIWQCTYITTTGYMAFDNFELSYTNEGNTSNPSPSVDEDDVNVNLGLSWTSGKFVQDVNGHEVFIGTDEQDVIDATSASHPNVDLHIVSEPLCALAQLDTNQTYYWRVDEVNGASVWKGDIWYFTSESGKAKNPNPSDKGGSQTNAILSWTASGVAGSHDVYFGTDEAAVTNASLPPAGDIDHDGYVDYNDIKLIAQQWLLDPPVGELPSADFNGDNNVDFFDFAIVARDWTKHAYAEFKGNQLLTSYNPGVLDVGLQYFWRVDEVNDGNMWKGDTWSFSTGYYYWPAYSPTIEYDYQDEYGTINPPTQVCPDGVTGVAGTYIDGWWCFRWGANKNSLVTSAAWIPMLQRFNEDFSYITDVMRWPRDKRARNGYYSTIYLYGSSLSTDSEPNTALGGWQSSAGGYPMVLASYYPVYSFDPSCTYGDRVAQRGAMIHEGIHCILSSMPGCTNSCWFNEGGNTWLQGTMEAQRAGNFSSMGWLSAGAAIAPFMPIECYSGWLQDDSFGGPCAQGVNMYEGGQQICTWRNLLGGTQYGECFPHALEVILGPKSIAWLWRNCHYSGRVLQDLAEAPGGLGNAQTRRLIQEYRARQAFCDFGQWSYAFRQLLNNNWGVGIQEEWSPYWIDVAIWNATCYVSTTQVGSVLTPEAHTLPGWSGGNQIPLTINPSATEAVVTFNPIGANMSCQLVYRDTSGNIHYGAPVSSGACSIPMGNVMNNVIVAVICNTNYIYSGESTRTAKYNYTLTMGAGVTGKANISTQWYNYNPSSYTITASAGAHGGISPSGAVVVSAGANRTFTFNPDSGYEVDQVILNGLPIGAMNSYTFNNVRGNHTISVTFVGI